MFSYNNYKYEDTVHCSFYSTKQLCDADWNELCDSINNLASTLARDYIWHRDAFKVSLPVYSNIKKDVSYYLTSVTCFGDNIEDEWFIVYLALEISRNFKDILAQVEDNDGAFLLIEAAEYVPRWANPDTTENRVFLYHGEIHLINPSIYPLDSNIPLNEAISLINQKYEETKASSEIQTAILQRIGNYPQKIKDISHTAIVSLPAEIAAILTLKPSLIAPIVNLYCNLDNIDLRNCRNIEYKYEVTTEIRFTKCLYAMLMNSKAIKINQQRNSQYNNKRCSLGKKITCAYQIIMKTSSKDIFVSPDYKKFITSLTKNGFFTGNLEGSKDYKKLLTNANEYFLNMECHVNAYVYKVISELKNSSEFETVNSILLKKNVDEYFKDHNDDWLHIHPDELNDYLNKHYAKTTKINKDIGTPAAITEQLSNFLKHKSDFEGIEKRDDNVKDDNEIDFDCDQFVNSVEKMLKIISSKSDIGDLTDSSDDEVDMDFENNLTDVTEQMDTELSVKLHTIPESCTDSNSTIVKNLVQSIKEESASGPSSTILSSIGVNKKDLLDSDDDEI